MQTQGEFKLTEVFKDRVKRAEKKKGATVLLTFKRNHDVEEFIQWAVQVKRDAEKEPDFELRQVIKALDVVLELADQNALDKKLVGRADPTLLRQSSIQRLAIKKLTEIKKRLESGSVPREMERPSSPEKDYPPQFREGKQQGFIGSSLDERS